MKANLKKCVGAVVIVGICVAGYLFSRNKSMIVEAEFIIVEESDIDNFNLATSQLVGKGKIKNVNSDISVNNLSKELIEIPDIEDEVTWKYIKKLEGKWYVIGYIDDKYFMDNTEVIIDDSIPSGTLKTDFISIDNKKFYINKTEEFLIKAIGFNTAWAENNNYIADKEGYKEVKELGFNTIHLWMDYSKFYDAAGNKLESGWKYINQNIECAKEYNMYIVLKMKSWPGEHRYSLFENSEDMDKYLKFWSEISNRYQNESTIIGYSCINEPTFPDGINKSSVYTEFLKNLVETIRENDKNHIIFIETHGLDVKLPSDSNLVQEVHFYQPYEFTHQPVNGKVLLSRAANSCSYPNDNLQIIKGQLIFSYSNDKKFQEKSSSNHYSFKQGEWQNLQLGYAKVVDKQGIMWNVRCDNLGENGTAKVNEVVITTYDTNLNKLREIKLDFDEPTEVTELSLSNKEGISGWDDSDENSGYLFIKDTLGTETVASKGTTFLKVEKDEAYVSIIADVYAKSFDDKADVSITLNTFNCDGIYTLNKEYLQYEINNIIKENEKYNVPLYIGEIGVVHSARENDLGGVDYLKDVINICQDNNLSFSFHCYFDSAFGIYYSSIRKNNADDLLNMMKDNLNY